MTVSVDEQNIEALVRVKKALLRCLDANDVEGAVIPIFGAGASIPSGVPGAYYLMQRMARDLIHPRQTERFITALDRDHGFTIVLDPVVAESSQRPGFVPTLVTGGSSTNIKRRPSNWLPEFQEYISSIAR